MSWDDGYHKQCQTCGDWYNIDKGQCPECRRVDDFSPGIKQWVEKVVSHQILLALEKRPSDG